MQLSIEELGNMTPAELETLAVTISNGWPRILNFAKAQLNEANFCIGRLPHDSINVKVREAVARMTRQKEIAWRVIEFVPERFRENVNRPITKTEILRMIHEGVR